MKLVARLAVAVAALALAVPALACEGHEKMKTTDKQEAKPAVATAAEKAPAKARPQAEESAAAKPTPPQASPN
jgi:hypothetical protein